MPLFDVILVTIFAAASIAGIALLRGFLLRPLSATNAAVERQRVFDVWLPLALAAPAAAVSVNTSFGARTTGSVGITIPVAAGLVAAGIGLYRVGSHALQPNDLGRVTRAIAATAMTGLLLLLLAAVYRLSIAVGQIAFAIWAVLLWMNAPPERSSGPAAIPVSVANRLALGSLSIVAIAACQSVLAGLVSPGALPVVGGLCALQAVFALALTFGSAGSAAVIRTGLWTAIFGVLLAVGLSSLSTLVRASPPLREREANLALQYGLGTGYGVFAIEAVLLVGLAATLLGSGGWREWARQAVAVAFILGAAWLIGWRLAAM